jgi:hypothetical protein
MLTNLKRIALQLMLIALLVTLHVNCSRKQSATAAVTDADVKENVVNEINTSATQLQNYAGRYNINSNEISWAEVTVENNRLYGQSSGNPKTELIKDSGDTYKVQGSDATVTFTRDNQQQVNGIVINYQGYEFKGEKVK